MTEHKPDYYIDGAHSECVECQTKWPCRTYQPGRWLGLIPYVHICEGSVICTTVFGLTSRHAMKRAEVGA